MMNNVKAAILAMVLVACTTEVADNDPGDPDSAEVNGTIIAVGGGTAPASSTAVVAWISDLGAGDFAYKWGDGPATSTTFSLDIAVPLPADALMGGKLGVGMAVLLPAGTMIPDGIVDENAFPGAPFGFSADYSIVFRADTTPLTAGHWANAFPAGLSCGKCVRQSTGFDTFSPVPCNEMKIQVGEPIEVCHWF